MARHKISSRDRWLIEAKKTVIKRGVEAINIDELSKKIGVAKTSFYHFFGSKSKFLDLLFRKGIEDATDGVISVVEKEPDAWSKINKLIRFVIDDNRQNELFLRRLRTYGLHKRQILQLINQTENQRMNFLKGLLIQTGLGEEDAEETAHYFYLYTLGLYERIYADPQLLDNKEKIYARMLRLIRD